MVGAVDGDHTGVDDRQVAAQQVVELHVGRQPAADDGPGANPAVPGCALGVVKTVREPAEGSQAPAPAPEPMADTPENRTKLCSTLQTNIAALRSGGPVVMQQNGKSVALDEAQRNQQVASAQAQYDQFCGQTP